MERKLILSSSPHIQSSDSTNKIMRDVVIALIPATIYGVYVFGMNAFMVCAAAIIACMAVEALMQKMRNKPITLYDWSAVITGLLLAMNLPANAPLWMPIVGAIFAIAIAKHAFGGLGHNFINPALAARAFLMSGWMGRMTS